MLLRKIYNFFASVKVAMALLVAILACCMVGVTVFRGERAWSLIFNTLWFNGLLVLLVVNVGCCFFPRMWGRKVTLVSIGMILFHLSFVAILGGIIYNSLFYFRGVIRLTEGETLSNGDPASYDTVSQGRFFALQKHRGETTLIKMHSGYKVDGTDKRAAYEIEVGEGILKKKDIIYITHSLEYKGFRYFNDREGYSLLCILSDKQGREIYGAHIPLQSLRQKDESYLYTTGTKEGPGKVAFPQPLSRALFALQLAYFPSKNKERGGAVYVQVWPVGKEGSKQGVKPLAEGKAGVGETFDIGQYDLSIREVRYWVGMNVRYDPGQPIVLAMLWVSLAGMVLTFFGRMGRARKQQSAAGG